MSANEDNATADHATETENGPDVLTIEALRLPCEHGAHRFCFAPQSPDSCPGGRVPTRTELIDMLNIDLKVPTQTLSIDAGGAPALGDGE